MLPRYFERATQVTRRTLPSADRKRWSSALVTDTQIAAYRRDGVVHLPGVLSGSWLETARDAFRTTMEKPGKYAEFMGEGVTWSDLFSAGAENRNIEMFQDQVFMRDISERIPELGQVVRDSPAAAIIARLMGSSTTTFFYAHPILKCKGSPSRSIPWHQDLPYWKVDGAQIGSVWIALDDMPLSASVRYVAGSHQWGLFRPRHFVDASPYAGREALPDMPDIDAKLESGETQALEFEVKAGDALCFDARVIHGSPGNPSPEQSHRRIALRFGGDDCTYCDREGETAIPTPEIDVLHGRAHGDHLSCDEFPVVWRQQE